MAKFKVTAPSGDYDGKVGAVQFHDGTADIDDERNPMELAYCRNAGYLVEEQTQRPAGLNQALDRAYSGQPSETPAEPGEFDPAAHNADEVLAYLDEASEAEAIRILDAEAAGKNRKGITGQRDAILANKKETDR